MDMDDIDILDDVFDGIEDLPPGCMMIVIAILVAMLIGFYLYSQ